MTVVVDSCAIVELFTGRNPHPELRRRAIVESLVAPELLDCRVLSVVRRLEREGKLSSEQIELAVARLAEAPIARVTHRPLIPRIWELRHSTTAYDGTYIALAEHPVRR